MNTLIKGIIAAMVTAMNEDESLNETEIRRQVNRQIAAGADAVFCLGTNGEAYIQSDEEKLEVIRIVVDETKGRVPVYVGTGCPGTKATIALSLKAKELGADVLSIISPYFAAISQKEIIEHYKAVAQAVDMPIVMYNMPARTGNNIEPATVAELAKMPNIVGIKDSSGNWNNLKAYIDATRDMDFSVLSGSDSLILPALQEGGTGGITAVANIYPETMVSIYQKFNTGDMAGAEVAQASIADIRACFKFGNPNTVTKKATNLVGNPVGPCRAPFNYLSEEAVEKIKETLEADKAKGIR
ncbi:Dihydrodipicolinate synthase [uncultured Eubacteriales bacterium]|uniref:4-hydroxy-tetrahydrodipicolinate synthase n=1 Tax=uncultured Eubacteriales bacterium TaxID=172733 RepID=A0A212KH51_9FIRM|nr:Dihydrodipicolinate synthase [uncultured Eubacteriales bacterium]